MDASPAPADTVCKSDALTPLLPTLAQYARYRYFGPDHNPDDIYQDMALHLLELDTKHPQKPMNTAYRKRAAWLARLASLRQAAAHRRRYTSLTATEKPDTRNAWLGDGEVSFFEDVNTIEGNWQSTSEPLPEDALLEAERLAELTALLPKIQAVVATLNPTNQRIVKLILAGAGRGDLPRTLGLSRSAVSHRKAEIRRAFLNAGITPL